MIDLHADSDKPLESGDLAKFAFFSILSIVTVLPLLIGIIPTGIIIFSLVMMRKSNDFSHVETAAKISKWYASLVEAIFIVMIIYHYAMYRQDGNGLVDELCALALVIIPFTVYGISINYLFLAPLRKHKSWVEKNGVFSFKSKTREKSELVILRVGEIKSHSVAEELIKLVDLKKAGYISEEEFNGARAKLFK